MNTIINFKTDKRVKAKAQKIASQMGLNLSDVLNIYLRSFIVKKELYINLNQDESSPSDELLDAVKNAKDDYKNNKLNSYDNIGQLVTHLEKF